MRLLTEDAVLVCAHPVGIVSLAPSQAFVTIAGRRVLIEPDPQGRPITGCANAAPPMRQCLVTNRVQTGYSTFVRIGGKPVCLDSVNGLTDGMPAGAVHYTVRAPGQAFVGAGG
jgi:hypothetical protein